LERVVDCPDVVLVEHLVRKAELARGSLEGLCCDVESAHLHLVVCVHLRLLIREHGVLRLLSQVKRGSEGW
jgi:hypothetical protein